jgi:hypothetical protein
MIDSDSTFCLLEREMTQVGKYQSELLLVVRASRGLPRALQKDYPELLRVFG